MLNSALVHCPEVFHFDLFKPIIPCLLPAFPHPPRVAVDSEAKFCLT